MTAWWQTTLEQFLRFGAVGVSNVAINFVVYSGLVYLGAHYLVASFVGASLGVINSFVLSKFFVFKVEGNAKRQFLRTLAVYAVQFGASWAGLITLIEGFDFNPYAAYLMNVVAVTLVSFIGMKIYAFQRNPKI